MTSLDTNVVVRLILGDDAKQAQAAERLVASGPCRVAATVLLECEWVLRAGYGLEAATIAASFRSLFELENIEAAEPTLITRALDAYAAGIDFADALHAKQRAPGETFATFDKALAKRAGKAGLADITLIPV
ncbi:MAG: type II toxin-antitoxin system VapC family toxin [Burkholderiales bacterium]|nr:type II toxin-antitoxin system VapC family toxin [Burkholderiales bacterium]